ncbi:MAG TPA: GNAT family N-acetyltransferase [Caldimonas sp.]|nr:GNAT family N-acetyltransferase [Caldimonas sp.]
MYLRRPRPSDRASFLAAVRASRALHGSWVRAPASAARFASYVRRFAGAKSRRVASATHVGLLACRSEDDAPVGVFNLSEIVRGSFSSAYLGYYAFEPHAGQGYMSEAFELVLRVAFIALRLHRIEVNVQPKNRRSIALARRAGFALEGFSRRYLSVAGRWRDHERWALLVEDWVARQRVRRSTR